MTASASQPKAARSERRIIERPRLIKLLDETDARTILLLAPAGYGKTTLARQWAKTLNGAVWVTLTAAHADVAWLATGIAQAIDGAKAGATRSIREHIQARMNPQRAPREIGGALAEHLEAADVRWVVLDDYHEIATSTEAEELVATLEHASGIRMLVTSRVRPRWASGRRFVYGEICEIGRVELAMTQQEASAVLGTNRAAASISAQADGWPAVIGLAAAAESSVVPRDKVPQALHRYLAEELFQRASAHLQEALLALSLREARLSEELDSAFGPDSEELIAEAQRLGFSSSDTTFDLHPLLREFLLDKLVTLQDAQSRVRQAVASNLAEGVWDRALSLVVRFELLDLVDQTLVQAFGPLFQSGRLATLANFATAVGAVSKSREPSVNVVLAEVAFRDGNVDQALDLADSARQALPADHPMASRAAALAGQIEFLKADFSSAERSFRRAQETAIEERDRAEAAYGLATASIFGEQSGASEAVDVLRASRHRSPVDFLRFVSSEVGLRLLGLNAEGLGGNLHLEAAIEMLASAEDPRVRTNLTYTLASALTQRAEYELARTWLDRFFADADEFGLEFAMPYANWTLAQIATGQRRFGEAERALQAVEDAAVRTRQRRHEFNAKALRARLLLQNGDAEAAVCCVTDEPAAPLIPSWSGEYLATRAVALACVGQTQASEEAAAVAQTTSSALEVQGLVSASRAVASLKAGDGPEALVSFLELAQRLDIWDPVVCAVRSAPALSDAIAARDDLRPALENLYRRTGDYALARRAGFRTRATDEPRKLLSPREYEVLGLIARGYRNGEISRALFIANSTTKVHVRHILEKLGVRTRAEAVARLRMFEAD